MKQLPCDVIRDLFPSYIDELTSEVTNSLVEEHVDGCENCKRVLAAMKNQEAEPVETAKEKEEIDFLKKTRSRNRKKLLLAIVVVLLVSLTAIVVKNWFVGSYITGEYVACQVQVVGKELYVSGTLLDTRYQIADMKFTEENGVVTISVKSVLRSPFAERNVEQCYVAGQDITEVHLGERILWADGKNISAITSAVYQSRHPYIGDMPANSKTADILNMRMVLGNYSNELQTAAEPYAWKFLMDWDAGNIWYAGAVEKITKMDSYAYVLLAVIDNLDEVVYEYHWSGSPAWRTITKKQASEFAGEDIKTVGKDVAKLQKLMEKAELLDTAYVTDYSQWLSEEKISMELVNLAEDELSMVTVYCYIYDELYCNQVVSNADGNSLERGAVLNFELLPKDFEGQYPYPENLELRIGIRDKQGRYQECVEQVNLPAQFGYTYSYTVTGTMEEGYHISQ